MIGLLARRLAGNAAGLIAAAITALYPGMWINDGMLLSETMTIFMTAVALTAIVRVLAHPHRPQRRAGSGSRVASPR